MNLNFSLRVRIITLRAALIRNTIVLLDVSSFNITLKMYKWCIRGVHLERFQFVSGNNYTSDEFPIRTGVLQGSVMGPLLFLLYVNNMAGCSPKLWFIHFADYTTAIIHGDRLPELCGAANRELAFLDMWLCSNWFSLNINETSLMIVSHRNRDGRLSFNDQLGFICKKKSKYVSILRKLEDYISKSLQKTMYQALVYPYLTFGIEVWRTSSKTCTPKLQAIQNRCVNTVFRCCSLIKVDLRKRKMLPLLNVHKLFV